MLEHPGPKAPPTRSQAPPTRSQAPPILSQAPPTLLRPRPPSPRPRPHSQAPPTRSQAHVPGPVPLVSVPIAPMPQAGPGPAWAARSFPSFCWLPRPAERACPPSLKGAVGHSGTRPLFHACFSSLSYRPHLQAPLPEMPSRCLV